MPRKKYVEEESSFAEATEDKQEAPEKTSEETSAEEDPEESELSEEKSEEDEEAAAQEAPSDEGVELTRASLAESRRASALGTRRRISAEAPLEELQGDEGQLVVDVYQTPDEIIVESPVAGVNPDDLDIAITPESVTIRGERRRERRVHEENYLYQECYWGRFSRTVVLPSEVDAETADASIKNGVLTITLPKFNRQRSKKLRVKSE